MAVLSKALLLPVVSSLASAGDEDLVQRGSALGALVPDAQVMALLGLLLVSVQYLFRRRGAHARAEAAATALPQHAMRVLLTGAFGNVGSSALQEMCALGYDVTCFELRSPASLKRYSSLGAAGLRFKVIWGDLSKRESVFEAVQGVRPEAIVHLGAIIPPMAYAIPKVSEAVNVGGTRLLMDAAAAMGARKPRFVFASSYSVFGSQNGLKPQPLLSGATEPNPMDLYGAQKVRCERMLRSEYAGELVVLRLGAILELEFGSGVPRSTFEFALSHPLEQRRHGCDTRDVGLAFANACRAPEAPGKILMIGGDRSWMMTAQHCVERVGMATGLGAVPESWHRKGSKEDDSTWYFESHMDTAEAQRILQFQRYSFDQYIAEVERRAWLTRPLAALFSPIVLAYLARWSPFVKDNTEGKPVMISQEQLLLKWYPQCPKDHGLATERAKACKADEAEVEPEPSK